MMRTRRSGYALAAILVLLGVALFGVGALVTISGLESKIARSQQEGITAYYVAEAGVADGLWRLNTDAAYRAALVGGSLNVTYTQSDVPQVGQQYTVTLTSVPSRGPGHGDITVNAQVTNGSLVARRQVQAQVFLGTTDVGLGDNAIVSGGSLSVTNGGSAVTVINGSAFSNGSFTVNQATFNLDTYSIRSVGTFSDNHGTITSGGIEAANYPPAPTALALPGVDFAELRSSANALYSAAEFSSLVSNAPGEVLDLPGPITYVDGNISLTSNARNKTITITGLLVINGSLTATSSASNLTVNVTDPGSGRSGIISSGSISIHRESWTIDGVVYATGSIQTNGISSLVIRGGVVSAGAMQLNAGSLLDIELVSQRITATLGVASGSTPTTVEVKHWEEQY